MSKEFNQNALRIFERGFNDLIYNGNIPPDNQENGFRLLIRGFPGTGKTTFSLHLLNSFLDKQEHSQGLIVYYQEHPKEYDLIAENFCLNFKYPPDTLQMTDHRFQEEKFGFIKKWISSSKKAGFQKLCILIDGLSFLESMGKTRLNEYLSSLMMDIHQENLFLIIIAEENILQKDLFFEYMADGVFHLSVEQERQRHRYIEITKLRYLDYSRGKHGFEMLNLPWESGSRFRIYPKPSTHLLKARKEFLRHNSDPIFSGIYGLDERLGSPSANKSLNAGDVFLILSEPGTPKLSWGLSFLHSIITEDTQNIEGHVLWASFGPSKLYSMLTSNQALDTHLYFLNNYNCFDKERNARAKSIYQAEIERINNSNCQEDHSQKYLDAIKKLSSIKLFDLDRPSKSLHPDRVVDCIVRQTEQYKSKKMPLRIVVDDFANIGKDFADPGRTDEYIIMLSRILKQHNAVCIMFVDLPFMFQRTGQILMPWINEVDFVGHLRWFDINNSPNLAFSLVKSRYKNVVSKPFHVKVFRRKHFIETVSLEDAGWPMVSMLNGQTETIHEAKIFFKFFDQSYPNHVQHEGILKEFSSRYPDDQNFNYVHKRSPNPKHWSFLGYAGTGHSNTKVVCLKHNIMNVLEKDDVLLEFPPSEWEKFGYRVSDTLPNKEQIRSKAYNIWGFIQRENTSKEANYGISKETKTGKSIPLFADIGVLCSQINKDNIKENCDKIFANIQKRGKSSLPPTADRLDAIPSAPPESWDALISMNNNFKDNKSLHPPWIHHLFALPSLTIDTSCFFSFFLELLFSYSGLSQNVIIDEINREGLKPFILSEAFEKTVNLLRKFVWTGTSPCPIEKINYQTAYFSRRWFSEIEKYQFQDPQLTKVANLLPPHFQVNQHYSDSNLVFDIAILPKVEGSKEKYGYSALEVYSTGIIKGALAPETAFMFISELCEVTNSIKRLDNRRGIPILRENWHSTPNSEQRLCDCNTIDSILNFNLFYSPSWIKNYWQMESKLERIFSNIFIGFDKNIQSEKAFNHAATIPNLQEAFLQMIMEID